MRKNQKTDSLGKTVRRIVRLVGKNRTEAILQEFEAALDIYYTNRKNRLRYADKLCVVHEDSADGG